MAGPLDADTQISAASSPPDIDMSLSAEEASILIEEWFFSNFEDPAQSTPYSSRDGGYQYIWGGPFETAEILDQAYDAHLRPDVREEVISSLEVASDLWVVNQSRILPPEEDEFDPDAPDPTDVSALYKEMGSRISAVEFTLRNIDAARRRIGHNNPPERIDEAPLNETERREMGQALAVLKSQPVQPQASAFASIENALSTLRKLTTKIGSYVVERGNDFATAVAKSAGDAVGKAIVGLSVWQLLGDNLKALVAAGARWFVTVNPPF